MEVWIWYALAYAASQLSWTPQTDWTEPRSTWIHCGSLAELDQRVPALPSKAALAGVPAFSAEEAEAGRLRAALLLLHAPPPAPAVPNTWNSQRE